MSEEKTEEKQESAGGIIKQTIDSATALTKAVPIYEDAIQPIAKETGKALGTVGKAVNVALAPISLVVWGYDQVQEFLENQVTEKLEHVPEDRITTPPPNVAGPAIEALKFSGQDETLQDMFANLIANSIDSKTALEAHPSFVDIIKSLTPDEGLLLNFLTRYMSYPVIDVKITNIKDNGYQVVHRNFSELGTLAHCKHPQLTSNYIDNLCRLGIIEIPMGARINDPKAYEPFNSNPIIAQLKQQFESDKENRVKIDQKIIQPTGIGRQFMNACIVDKKQRK